MKTTIILSTFIIGGHALSKASALGRVGVTTSSGTAVSSGNTIPSGSSVFGPFEAGFTSTQDFILATLGCATGKGYVQAGLDTQIAEQIVAEDCGVDLPRWEGDNYISLLDTCGGHTRTYHFHERLQCLYNNEGAHSTKVAEGLDGQNVYGKWEDFSAGELPSLDACGGHFGVTPECPDGCYHYHVQDQAPFTIGCFGPNDDGSLVSVANCRELYASECAGEDITQLDTPSGVVEYDPWCPCFDATGSNVGTEELPAIIGNTTPETDSPTNNPTPEPTKTPTPNPTKQPTKSPTPVPTLRPTTETTNSPTPVPTVRITLEPTTETPTPQPTASVTTPPPTRRKKKNRGMRRLLSKLLQH